MSLFYTNETNTLKNHKEKVGDIMTSLKPINRRVGSLFAVAALVLATITPGLVPAFASAAQIAERSIELGSSSKEASNVDYKVTFTPSQNAGAVVFDFCSDSPFIGEACAAPAGFDASAAEADGFTVSGLTTPRNNSIVVAGDIEAPSAVIELNKLRNPNEAGPLYVRIVTFDTADHAKEYASADLGTGVIDRGSAAVSITDTVGVSAAVLESMTFCVSGNEITSNNCTRADAAALTAPTVQLGAQVGNIKALDSSDVYEGSVYTQMSTNAANGAVVSLKTVTACGGLKRVGVTTCDIEAAGTSGGITAGQAKFGVKVSAATNPSAQPQNAANSVGDYQIATGSTYDTSIFTLNYDNTRATGVTSPYGDPVLDTKGAPVNNKNITLTFGASAANNTPAGMYSTDLSLIATGKF